MAEFHGCYLFDRLGLETRALALLPHTTARTCTSGCASLPNSHSRYAVLYDASHHRTVAPPPNPPGVRVPWTDRGGAAVGCACVAGLGSAVEAWGIGGGVGEEMRCGGVAGMAARERKAVEEAGAVGVVGASVYSLPGSPSNNGGGFRVLRHAASSPLHRDTPSDPTPTPSPTPTPLNPAYVGGGIAAGVLGIALTVTIMVLVVRQRRRQLKGKMRVGRGGGGSLRRGGGSTAGSARSSVSATEEERAPFRNGGKGLPGPVTSQPSTSSPSRSSTSTARAPVPGASAASLPTKAAEAERTEVPKAAATGRGMDAESTKGPDSPARMMTMEEVLAR
ncbi:hypothetical protein HDU96_004149 [Phlyctochytrium bullatum]|nr:hypothetical protein HDU96_004149 [Phlyctochytrium bullatum]